MIDNFPTILALDFDGVICDGLIEYFQTFWRTYCQIWKPSQTVPDSDLASSSHRNQLGAVLRRLPERSTASILITVGNFGNFVTQSYSFLLCVSVITLTTSTARFLGYQECTCRS